MVLDSIFHLLEENYPDKKRLHRAINILKRPQNILKKKLILKLVSSSKKKIFQSFRIQHSDARGSFMGGIAYSKGLNEEDVKKLAFDESIKSAITDIQFGGAFGGIDLDQNKITLKDLERLTKIYSQFLTNHVGTWKDVTTTNLGTNKETLGWMMEAYEKKRKFHSPATFVSNGHNLDGATIILNEYYKSSGFSSRFRKLDVAISGFEDRAYVFASNLNSKNFRTVAVSDKSGGIVNSNGLDPETVKKLKDKFTSLKEVSVMNNIEFISDEKLLQLPVDILVIVTDYEIEAKIKTETLPSILLNSGFSVLAYLDWVQKMHGYKWSREEVSKKLYTTMTKTFSDVKNIVDEKKINYEEACYYLGAKRIIDAMMERGRV